MLQLCHLHALAVTQPTVYCFYILVSVASFIHYKRYLGSAVFEQRCMLVSETPSHWESRWALQARRLGWTPNVYKVICEVQINLIRHTTSNPENYYYICTHKCHSFSVTNVWLINLPLLQELCRRASTVSLSSFSFQVSVGLTSMTRLTSFLRVGGTPSVPVMVFSWSCFIRGPDDVNERNMQVW